jgi:hypothetical protein
MKTDEAEGQDLADFGDALIGRHQVRVKGVHGVSPC